jgi:hypothetical protein
MAKVGEKPIFAAVGRQVSPKTTKSNDQMDRTECAPPISRNLSVLSVPNLWVQGNTTKEVLSSSCHSRLP